MKKIIPVLCALCTLLMAAACGGSDKNTAAGGDARHATVSPASLQGEWQYTLDQGGDLSQLTMRFTFTTDGAGRLVQTTATETADGGTRIEIAQMATVSLKQNTVVFRSVDDIQVKEFITGGQREPQAELDSIARKSIEESNNAIAAQPGIFDMTVLSISADSLTVQQGFTEPMTFARVKK